MISVNTCLVPAQAQAQSHYQTPVQALNHCPLHIRRVYGHDKGHTSLSSGVSASSTSLFNAAIFFLRSMSSLIILASSSSWIGKIMEVVSKGVVRDLFLLLAQSSIFFEFSDTLFAINVTNLFGREGDCGQRKILLGSRNLKTGGRTFFFLFSRWRYVGCCIFLWGWFKDFFHRWDGGLRLMGEGEGSGIGIRVSSPVPHHLLTQKYHRQFQLRLELHPLRPTHLAIGVENSANANHSPSSLHLVGHPSPSSCLWHREDHWK